MFDKVLVETIVANLNEQEFSQEFTAIRVDVPNWELKHLRGLKVMVRPAVIAHARFDRGRWMHNVTVQIGVQQKLEAPPNANPVVANTALVAAVDSCRELLFEINAYLRQNQQQGDAFLDAIETIPYDIDGMQESNVYTGIVNATYKVLG